MGERRFQFLPNAPLDEADVVILPIPLESTVSFRGGTAGAPDAVLAAAEQLEYYEEDRGWSPFRYMSVCVADPLAPRTGEAEAQFHARIAEVAGGLDRDNLLVVIGGEHSLTPSVLAGRMPDRGCVVHLDAHADLREHYHGTPYSHACPVHRIRAQGHRIVMAGIRAVYEPEAGRIAADHDIELFMDRDLQRGDGWPRLLDSLRGLSGPVWLTVDMDAFDPALVPGVGTPQPGGLSWYQAVEILEAVVDNPAVDLRGVDVVELVPDPSNVSETVAAKLVQKAISFWGRARGFERRAPGGAQSGVDHE